VVVNTHAHAGQMAAHLARVAPTVMIAHEPELLDTGGGLHAALPMLGAEAVYTLNADMVWRGPNPLGLLAAGWEPGRMGALLALVPRDAAQGHAGPGDFRRGPDGRLARRGTEASAPCVYAGAQIVATGPVAAEPPGVFSLNRVWDRLLDEGRLYGIVYPGAWVDVGRPEGIALAEAELAR
jgi:MurNAc alpha-1-phosphate uridylyltransferase